MAEKDILKPRMVRMSEVMWEVIIGEAKRDGFVSASEFLRSLVRHHFKMHP